MQWQPRNGERSPYVAAANIRRVLQARLFVASSFANIIVIKTLVLFNLYELRVGRGRRPFRLLACRVTAHLPLLRSVELTKGIRGMVSFVCIVLRYLELTTDTLLSDVAPLFDVVRHFSAMFGDVQSSLSWFTVG